MNNTLKIIVISGGALLTSVFFFRNKIKRKISNTLTDIICDSLKSEKLKRHTEESVMTLVKSNNIYDNISELITKTFNDEKLVDASSIFINKLILSDSTNKVVVEVIKSMIVKTINNPILINSVSQQSIILLNTYSIIT